MEDLFVVHLDLQPLEDADFDQSLLLPCGHSLPVVEPSAGPDVSDDSLIFNISSDQYQELLSMLSRLEESVASLESARSTPERSSPAVLTCTTKEDVTCAEVFRNTTGFRILVDEQEADRAGGPSVISLEPGGVRLAGPPNPDLLLLRDVLVPFPFSLRRWHPAVQTRECPSGGLAGRRPQGSGQLPRHPGHLDRCESCSFVTEAPTTPLSQVKLKQTVFFFAFHLRRPMLVRKPHSVPCTLGTRRTPRSHIRAATQRTRPRRTRRNGRESHRSPTSGTSARTFFCPPTRYQQRTHQDQNTKMSP
ncbi:PREDICTED: uncharacterized protein LOC106908894 [Poecilia mexicana]|uniref:uncharacterized protein LOC106908894 n=1 Tax=Poecilia mexicana TaxID=48701 RepID=UPI00072DCA11|nr:PREDICTED: uncharacterized protein LOC106908894 [Poecilia mexicana]XP_016520525.1 PREDICTED: uncharacterized protein LOC107834183 [Poecilia formosa]